MVENLNRLNEDEEADRLGVFHVLGILENVLAFNPNISKTLIKKSKTLRWTLNRIQNPVQDDNRGYAAELLSILLQSDRENRLAYGKGDGVETSLKVLSVSHLNSIFVSDRLNDHLAIQAERPHRGGRDRVHGERLRWPVFCAHRTRK